MFIVSDARSWRVDRSMRGVVVLVVLRLLGEQLKLSGRGRRFGFRRMVVLVLAMVQEWHVPATDESRRCRRWLIMFLLLLSMLSQFIVYHCYMIPLLCYSV